VASRSRKQRSRFGTVRTHCRSGRFGKTGSPGAGHLVNGRLPENFTATPTGSSWPVTATDPRPPNGCNPSEAVSQSAPAADD
jgi:hypothetical protein